jgi:hypothetical protein
MVSEVCKNSVKSTMTKLNLCKPEKSHNVWNMYIHVIIYRYINLINLRIMKKTQYSDR